MNHKVTLESHMDNARKLKKLKGHKDRLLDALRSLAEATAIAPSLTFEQQKALDKTWKALQYYHEDSDQFEDR